MSVINVKSKENRLTSTADEDMPFLPRAEEDFPDSDQEWRDPYGPLSISALAREPELYVMEAEYLSVQEMKQDPKKGEYSPHPVDTTLLPDALMLYCLTSRYIHLASAPESFADWCFALQVSS